MSAAETPFRSPEDLPFLAEGGEMGALTRAYPWQASPLGPAAEWPPVLQALVGVMLNSNQPMFITWGEQRIMLYNDRYAPLLGLRHPDTLGNRFEDVWYDILETVRPILDKAYAGESTQMDDIAFVMHRHGYPEEAHFAFSYTPIRDQSGQVAGMFCACTETTDLVFAERRRAVEARRTQDLFRKAPGFIAVLSGPDHVFDLANESYLKLVGHRDVVGKPARQAIPEIRHDFFDLLDEVYSSGQTVTKTGMHVAVSRSPGAEPEERRLDVVFQPIMEEDGSVSGIFIEGYDATERHQAVEALRESEERFRLIADSAPVSMWVTKLDRKRGFVNRAYVEFLGVSYEEALDFDWRTIVHPDDRDRLVGESRAGEAALKPFRLEARFRRSDGEWRWLRSESQPRWGPNGEHTGFIGIATDITDSKLAEATLREVADTFERRVNERTTDLRLALKQLQTEAQDRARAEEALRQAQKMDAVGRLTGGIAHDFNNLLTPIVGGLQLIAGKLTDKRLKRLAEGALESAQRGAKLTGQLLAFSRVQRISMSAVPVNAVIADLRKLLAPAVGAAIPVEIRLDPAVDHALCDANQLENALLNLAINARDAMPNGGRLTIATARESLPAAPDLAAGDYVRISVADTGEGMTPEVLARATEPFFSTKPLGKGTGLGLAQVYGIARQSGGTLRIESKPGKGTCVHILLPVAAASHMPAIRSEAGGWDDSAGDRQAATVLVIDDDPNVRSFLCDSLEALGYEVILAESGAEGLEYIVSGAPDIVLLDYAMPGMSGADAARTIRHARPELPILFVTGYAESDQIEAAVGPDYQVLRKPFTVAELDAAVAAHLRKDAPAEPDRAPPES